MVFACGEINVCDVYTHIYVRVCVTVCVRFYTNVHGQVISAK